MILDLADALVAYFSGFFGSAAGGFLCGAEADPGHALQLSVIFIFLALECTDVFNQAVMFDDEGLELVLALGCLLLVGFDLLTSTVYVITSVF